MDSFVSETVATATAGATTADVSQAILSTAFASLSPPFFILSARLLSVPFSAAFAIADAHPTPMIHINVFQNQNFHIDAIISPITPTAPNAHPDLVASERIVDQVETVSDATFHTTAPIHPATAPTHSPTTPAALPAVVDGTLLGTETGLFAGIVTGAIEGACWICATVAGFD